VSDTAVSNLPLRRRPIDIFFAVMFTIFIVTSCIADMLPTLGVDFTQPNGTFLVDSNYWYAHDADPLFMNPPVWMRIVTGLSAFVYLAFYLVLVPSLIKGWNRIQLPAVIYATMIASITGIIVFGVEFFGDPDAEPREVPRVQPAVRAHPAAAAHPHAQADAVHAQVLSRLNDG
jgi:hypothetical protein